MLSYPILSYTIIIRVIPLAILYVVFGMDIVISHDGFLQFALTPWWNLGERERGSERKRAAISKGKGEERELASL